MDNNILIILAVASTLAGLITEAIKSILGEYITIRGEVLAAIVSVISGILTCVAYAIMFDVAVTAKIVVYGIIIVLMTVISSSLGYDKVVGVFTKIFEKKEV